MVEYDNDSGSHSSADKDKYNGNESMNGSTMSKEEEEEEKERVRAKLKRIASIASLVLIGSYFYVKRKRGRNNKAGPVSSVVLSSILSFVFKKKLTEPGAPRVSRAQEAPLSLLLRGASEGRVKRAMLNSTTVLYNIIMPDRKHSVWRKSTIPSDSPSIQSSLLDALSHGGCDDISTLPDSLISRMAGPATASIPFIYLALLYLMLRRLQRHQMDNDHDHGSIIQRHHPKPKTTFNHVAGIDTVKIELAEIVSYLRNPHKYTTLGASIPRGVLLYGPPGSGKTLLAKALAGEANVDAFVSCTGSDFVEMYVGRGAARVRELFGKVKRQATTNYIARRKRMARRNTQQLLSTHASENNLHSSIWKAYYQIQDTFSSFILRQNHDNDYSQQQVYHKKPTAVVFIDEIDALAKKRGGDQNNSFLGSSTGGGSDEREQTLNQLLSEMDGFDTSSTSFLNDNNDNNQEGFSRQVTVIVVAATNRPDVLDPALLRPGRFDRHVHVHYPDAKGRKEILLVHSKRIRLLHHNHKNNDTNNETSQYELSSTSHNNSKNNNNKKTNEVDFNRIAADDITGNFSGADLSNLINEAAFLAVRDGCTAVGQTHLLEAAKKVGRMKKSGAYRGAENNANDSHVVFHSIGGGGFGNNQWE